jgi:predicted DNA-binding protein with PD1-like motif
MKSRVIHQGDATTYVLIFDRDDEVMSTLRKFAQEHGVDAGHFTAIGAFREVTLAFFDWERRAYQHHDVPQQVEVLSLVGDIATHEGKPVVHAHAVVGLPDTSTRGGHLVEARVRPTLEVVLTETPAHLRRTVDEASGLPLIDIDASHGAE